MSIHCGICGGPDNWVKGVEVDPIENEHWRVIRIGRDYLTEKYAGDRHNISEIWVHADCLKTLLCVHTAVDVLAVADLRCL